MAQYDLSGTKTDDFLECSIVESKVREKLFELGIKRKVLEENRVFIAKLDYEKHILMQRVEKCERELSDVNIHLQVAIKAAREAEAERSTARELIARQGAQLEAASKEREFLQQINRTMQLERDQMKRDLEDTKSKMISQSHFLDLIKKKDSQTKGIIDTLTLEVNRLEKSQTELNEMCSTIADITKAVSTLLHQRKLELTELGVEKSRLQERILSLCLKIQESEKTTSFSDNVKNDYMPEWNVCQEDMKRRMKTAEEENSRLQLLLDKTLETLAKVRTSETSLSSKISSLEEELQNSNAARKTVENAETQTDPAEGTIQEESY